MFLPRAIHKIYFVCHPLTAAVAAGGTNHWTMSLDVGDGQGVRFDLQPNPQQTHTNGGSKAHLIVSHLSYVVTQHAVRSDPVSVTYSRTVGWLIDYLISAGRLRYAFNPQGVGCRNWMTDTAKLLSDVGEANQTESETARNAIAYIWPDQKYSQPAVGVYF